MKKKIWIYSLIVMGFVLMLTFSCKKKSETVTDINGNVYHTVTIDTQVWMVENLNVATFRNRDTIIEAKTPEEWEKAGLEGKPIWSYYDFNSENGKKYGKLYNWYAIKDSRGLAPVGWHVSSHAEWIKLTDFISGNAGIKLKAKNGWKEGSNGTDDYGFSALPGGNCSERGQFSNVIYQGNWWTSTDDSTSNAWVHDILNVLEMGKGNKSLGLSVRCIKD